MLRPLPRLLQLEEGQQRRIMGRKVKKREEVYKGQKSKAFILYSIYLFASEKGTEVGNYD